MSKDSGPQEVDWGDIEDPRSSGSKWMKLTEGTHTVRLLGKAFAFNQHFEDDVYTGVCIGEDDCPVCARGFRPSKRYLINVIDRSDGKIKVLESGKTIFAKFKMWANANKMQPGGAEGPDFVIEVDIPGGKKRFAKYSVMPTQVKKLTPEEAAVVKATGLYDLRKEKPHPTPEEVEAIIENNLKSQGEGSRSSEQPSYENQESSNQDAPKDAPAVSDEELDDLLDF